MWPHSEALNSCSYSYTDFRHFCEIWTLWGKNKYGWFSEKRNLLRRRMMYRRMKRSTHTNIINTSRSSKSFHGLKYLTANEMKVSMITNHLITERILLGFGCSNTSVCFKIFSVQCFVHSALVRRFSKCASNSVFSAWPNFSSVNCMWIH